MLLVSVCRTVWVNLFFCFWESSLGWNIWELREGAFRGLLSMAVLGEGHRRGKERRWGWLQRWEFAPGCCLSLAGQNHATLFSWLVLASVLVREEEAVVCWRWGWDNWSHVVCWLEALSQSLPLSTWLVWVKMAALSPPHPKAQRTREA